MNLPVEVVVWEKPDVAINSHHLVRCRFNNAIVPDHYSSVNLGCEIMRFELGKIKLGFYLRPASLNTGAMLLGRHRDAMACQSGTRVCMLKIHERFA